MARNSSANLCDDVWPPGFRFHPTDEELVLYYLKRKICHRKLKLDIIAEVDVYKWDPEDLPGLSMLKNGDRQWFFFSPRDRKYPNGARANRATRLGYWKTTGKDRTITCNSRNVGIKKTLVFYKGRAPKGERTDWVMHEYTLDEDELKRWQNTQDYYAIYKVFKKSGPGPKNGEQYGAPFREDDWVDDECVEVTRDSDQVDYACQWNKVSAINDCRSAQLIPPLSNVEEPVSQIVDEPAPQPGDIDDFELALSQFLGEEGIPSTMVNTSGEAIYAEPCETYAMSTQKNDLEASSEVTQPATSGLPMWDVPEMNSPANTFELQPHAAQEDYLEMDDLLGPEPFEGVGNLLLPHPNDGRLPENSQLRKEDGLGELDLYYDADAFLRDLEPFGQSIDTVLCPNSQESGFVNHIGFHMEPYADAADGVGDKIWTHDANSVLSSTTESSHGPISLPSTGVICSGISTSIATELNQNQNGKEVDGAQPWFSSTLWSFVESIPAAPASAAESALVNKAFQRMSSFRRVRVNAKSTFAAAHSITGGRMKGFFLFSFLAALFAVLVCVFFGANASGAFGKLHYRINL